MKVLITGFEPFHDHKENPSAKLLPLFKGEAETLLLPVSFERAWQVLEPKLREKDWDFIVMLGLAADRKDVCLELVALNGISAPRPDNDGKTVLFESIDQKGEAALLSPFPLHGWAVKAKEMNLPIRVSLSAGSFVCNYIYYKARQITTKALFVHVPLEEFVALEKMAECVSWLVERPVNRRS